MLNIAMVFVITAFMLLFTYKIYKRMDTFIAKQEQETEKLNDEMLQMVKDYIEDKRGGEND